MHLIFDFQGSKQLLQLRNIISVSDIQTIMESEYCNTYNAELFRDRLIFLSVWILVYTHQIFV